MDGCINLGNEVLSNDSCLTRRKYSGVPSLGPENYCGIVAHYYIIYYMEMFDVIRIEIHIYRENCG